MSIYQRGKSWYYDFQSRRERYAGCIGQVSKTVAKEVLARRPKRLRDAIALQPRSRVHSLRIWLQNICNTTGPIDGQSLSNGTRWPSRRSSRFFVGSVCRHQPVSH
jgi:hypothetical protein